MLWTDVKEMIGIEDVCEIVAIRPMIKFLLRDRMNGVEPFKKFQDVLDTEGQFDARAKYHKACMNAYYQGTMNCVSVSLI